MNSACVRRRWTLARTEASTNSLSVSPSTRTDSTSARKSGSTRTEGIVAVFTDTVYRKCATSPTVGGRVELKLTHLCGHLILTKEGARHSALKYMSPLNSSFGSSATNTGCRPWALAWQGPRWTTLRPLTSIGTENLRL